MDSTAQIMGAISILSGVGAELVQLRQAVASLEQRVSDQQGQIAELQQENAALKAAAEQTEVAADSGSG